MRFVIFQSCSNNWMLFGIPWLQSPSALAHYERQAYAQGKDKTEVTQLTSLKK